MMDLKAHLRIAITLVAPFICSQPLFSQVVKEVKFLGPNCSTENASASKTEKLEELNLKFSALSLSGETVKGNINSVHCKIQLDVQAPKNHTILFKNLDIQVNSEGAQSRAKLFVNFFDGEAVRYSQPLVTKLNSKHLPKTVRIDRVGVGSDALNCGGKVVPFQLSVFVMGDYDESSQVLPGSIRIDGIDNIKYQIVSCI